MLCWNLIKTPYLYSITFFMREAAHMCWRPNLCDILAYAMPKSCKRGVQRDRDSEIMTMTPSLSYVEAAMRHGDVPSTLKKWSFAKRVYMVTGIRVVRGATMSRSSEASTKFATSAQLTTNTGFDPVGVDAGISSSSSKGESVGGISDFVFAYRLNEIRYRGTVTHRPYRGGDVSSAEEHAQVPSEVSVDDFEVLGISEDAFRGREADYQRVTVHAAEDLECYIGRTLTEHREGE